jgi:hypothetical protein
MSSSTLLPFSKLPPRANRGKRKFGDFVDSSKISKATLNMRVNRKARAIVKLPRIAGRSVGGPPVGYTPRVGSGQVIYPDVTQTTPSDPWNDQVRKKVRLIYPKLDPNGGNYQGLLITDSSITSGTDTELALHFNAITQNMMAKQSSSQITEETGEAACAMQMVKRYPGAKMKWGRHVHSGAGIDQIWKQEGDPVTYYIVEAKGPGEQLRDNQHGPPPAIQEQMSLGWVMHNLVTMARQAGEEYQIARDLLDELGLQERLNERGGPWYEAYGNASKSYYACNYDPAFKSARLIGVVITASWTSDTLLGTPIEVFNDSALATSPGAVFLADRVIRLDLGSGTV